MEIKSIYDKEFAVYGKVLEGYDFAPMLSVLCQNTEKPSDSVIYVPEDENLEALSVSTEMENRFYGGMPIQVGYCNGNSNKLNCLEYHRGSEINVMADDVVLLVSSLQKVENGKLNTSQVEAFLAPIGSAVQLYETTLHYAPCTAPGGDGFRVVIVLPKGTNHDKVRITKGNDEDKLLWACNKWLIAHPDADEALQGAFVGLIGENITVI